MPPASGDRDDILTALGGVGLKHGVIPPKSDESPHVGSQPKLQQSHLLARRLEVTHLLPGRRQKGPQLPTRRRFMTGL